MNCRCCGNCCREKTCVPTPIEIDKISNYLGIKRDILLNEYFCYDRHKTEDPMYPRPLGKNILHLAGKFIPDEVAHNEGPCIFLEEDNHCRIYAVRPANAKRFQCLITNPVDEQEIINKEWKGVL